MALIFVASIFYLPTPRSGRNLFATVRKITLIERIYISADKWPVRKYIYSTRFSLFNLIELQCLIISVISTERSCQSHNILWGLLIKSKLETVYTYIWVITDTYILLHVLQVYVCEGIYLIHYIRRGVWVHADQIGCKFSRRMRAVATITDFYILFTPCPTIHFTLHFCVILFNESSLFFATIALKEYPSNMVNHGQNEYDYYQAICSTSLIYLSMDTGYCLVVVVPFDSEEPNIQSEEFHFNAFHLRLSWIIGISRLWQLHYNWFSALCLAYMAGQIIECMLHVEEATSCSASRNNFSNSNF